MKTTDKMRLDWLENEETAFYTTTTGVCFENSGFFVGSLRKAIDSAMKASRRGEK